MAKRVFDIAKELGVKSKAIIDKCSAEGIPNIQNHMSSISAGLEATVREWFSDSHTSDSGTAVETAAPVDIQQVRVEQKPKTRAAAKRKAIKAGDEASSNDSTDGATTALEEPPTHAHKPASGAPGDAQDSDEHQSLGVTEEQGVPGVESIEIPDEETQPPMAHQATATARRIVPPPAPPAIEPREGSSGLHAPDGHEEGSEAAQGHLAAARRTPPTHATPAPPATTPTIPAKPSFKPRMNIPTRPTQVTRAGPQLDVKTPAKVLGPKVIRVEAPEVIEAPRARRPQTDSTPAGRGQRTGLGVGTRAPLVDDEAGAKRNKRRGADRATGRGRRSGEADLEAPHWSERDLAERESKLSRAEGFMRSRRRDQKIKDQTGGERATSLASTGGAIRIASPISIKELSSATGVKAAEIVKELFLKGITATVNSGIEAEQAQEIMIKYEIELEVVQAPTAQEAVATEFEQRESISMGGRCAVVTILGHVDHGKTSLLDKIRNTNIAAGEAGGITQSTRAFRVPVKLGDNQREVCFFDTPGHQAFTEMRSRGANMTDIVVLVVSAADGVMPQTIESISHAKAAGVPVVVALNKIDLPSVTDSMIQKVLGQLAEQGLNPSEWGGDTDVVRTSATTGKGVQELLETLEYRAELLELKADFQGHARGVVIEAKIVEGRGATANLLVQEGLLQVGDIIVAGRAHGRIRDITDDRGGRIKEAGPSTPVLISGLSELPAAGDKFYIVDTLRKAQDAAEHRRQQDRERELATPKVTLDSMFAHIKDGQAKELRVVVKADVQGSVDVIRTAVEEISTPEVKVRVLHAAAGGVSESDISLAAASGAVVLGFNVIPSSKARRLAEDKKIEIRSYQVIYELLDDMKNAAEGLLAPEIRQEVIGHAEVRKVFKVSRIGAIAGCLVTDGTIERNALIRVTRNDIVVENDRVLEQLKRFKDDARDVRSGQECGMKIAGYDDIKEGDILECYRVVEIRRTLGGA